MFGVVWHTIVVLLMGQSLGDAASAAMIAGAIAGLCAGFLTVRSRQHRHGRESVLDGVVTYYLAVVAYAVSLVVIGLLADLGSTGKTLGVVDALAASWALSWYAIIFATLLGIVLIPLCFLTRHLLWRLSGRMRPNKT